MHGIRLPARGSAASTDSLSALRPPCTPPAHGPAALATPPCLTPLRAPCSYDPLITAHLPAEDLGALAGGAGRHHTGSGLRWGAPELCCCGRRRVLRLVLGGSGGGGTASPRCFVAGSGRSVGLMTLLLAFMPAQSGVAGLDVRLHGLSTLAKPQAHAQRSWPPHATPTLPRLHPAVCTTQHTPRHFPRTLLAAVPRPRAGMAGGGGDSGQMAQFVSNASFATLTLIYTFTELLDLSDKVGAGLGWLWLCVCDQEVWAVCEGRCDAGVV